MRRALFGSFLMIILLLTIGYTSPVAFPEPQLIKKGAISYYLFLPRYYDPDREYPLLLCLSPSGNGAIFKSFYPVTSKYGVVMVGSNDFANMIPADKFLPKLIATLIDVKRKVRIKEGEVYACGFSGGGMATYVFSYFYPGTFKGLIVNSGAIHGNLYSVYALRRMNVKKVALLCGDRDRVVSCEYMRGDEGWLERAGIQVKLFKFKGGHQLAPPNVFEKALLWVMSQ